MTIMAWLQEKLMGHGHPDNRFREALHVTDEVAHTARELRQQIEPYAKMDDPFIALWVTRFENEQERRIHEGPGEH